MEIIARHFLRPVRENRTGYLSWKGEPLTPFCGSQYQYHTDVERNSLKYLSDMKFDFFFVHICIGSCCLHEDTDGIVKMRDYPQNLQLNTCRPPRPHNPRSLAQPLRNPSL